MTRKSAERLATRQSTKRWSVSIWKNRQEQLQKQRQGFCGGSICTCGEYLRDLSFAVGAGECLAVQILDNNVFAELRSFLLQDQMPEGGELWVGKRQTAEFFGSQDRSDPGTGNADDGLSGSSSYMEHLCISLSMRVPALWLKKSIRRSIRREYGPILGEEVFDLPVSSLTERQKYQMIYTRIQLAHPDVVFGIQPFKGSRSPAPHAYLAAFRAADGSRDRGCARLFEPL